MDHHGEAWNVLDVERLRVLLGTGCRISEAARVLGRTTPAVRNRAHRLGLVQRP